MSEFTVSCNHSFENVGADYVGPLYFKENLNYCVGMPKCYVLFKCTATRAVYLELTPDVGVHSLIFSCAKIYFKERNTKIVHQ